MQELGGVLRSTRESLGLTLDEIESRTKIRKRYLSALEKGDWSVLPGRVYARGFVRNYAEALGLDGAELLQSYVDGRDTVDEGDNAPQSVDDREVSTRPDSEVKETHEQTRQEAPRPKQDRDRTATGDPPIFSTGSKSKMAIPVRRPGGPIVQTVVIVAALIVIGGGYIALRHHAHPTSHANAAAVRVTGNTTASNANQSGNVSNNAQNSTVGDTNATSSPPSKPAVVIKPEPLQKGVRPYQVKNVSSLDVVLKVNNGQLWLSSKADGKVVNGNDTVNPGQSKTYHANKTVRLYLGHVQGIQITVNGKTLPLPNVQNPVHIKIVKQSS